MNRRRTVALWVIANILILICGTIAGYAYISYRLDQIYGSDRPIWTNDFIIEPLAMGFLLLLVLVIVMNAVAVISFRIGRHWKSESSKKGVKDAENT